jgi:hypothetical protein
LFTTWGRRKWGRRETAVLLVYVLSRKGLLRALDGMPRAYDVHGTAQYSKTG